MKTIYVTQHTKQASRCDTRAEAMQWLSEQLARLHEDERIRIKLANISPTPSYCTWDVIIEFEHTFPVSFYPKRPWEN